MSRIYQYPVVTEIGSDDYLALGSATNGSRAILASDLAPVIGSKTITERGTYKASDDNMDGYGQVTVDIPYTDIHVASGDIATFEGEDLPLKSLKVTVTPYQDLSHGDPSPENICPIIGWAVAVVTRCGKNLWDEADTVERWIDTEGNEVNRENSLLLARKVVLGQTYTLSNANATSAQNILAVAYYGASGNLISRAVKANGDKFLTVAVPANAVIGKFCIFDKTLASNIQLELGTTATTYEPYNGHTYTIDLDGTRYGGTLDVTTGVLTVDRAIVDMGDLNYTYYENNKRFAVRLDDGKPSRTSYGLNTALCECYPVVTSKNSSMADGSVSVGSNFFSSSICSLIIHDENYTDATAFKTSVNGQELVYELATPITVQLAPTPVKSLEGTNKIFANCGAVDVEYQTVWERPTN